MLEKHVGPYFMRRKEWLLVSLLVLALVPYFVVCFYALPFADDFCYGWTSAEKISFTHRFLRQYLGCSGRYSAHVLLCNHPLISGRILCYQSAIFAFLIAFTGALVLFIWQIIDDLLIAVMIALGMLLFYLTYVPQLAEGIYWYTGLCDYGWGTVFLLLHLAFLPGWFNGIGVVKWVYFFAAAVLLVVSIGFNEVGAVLIPAYYFLAVIVFYFSRTNSIIGSKTFGAIAGLFALAVVASAFVVFAPGNFVRSQEFAGRFNFFHSVLFGALQTARFTATWLFSIPALGFSALVIAKANKLPETPLFRTDYRLILSVAFFTVFMGAFLPYYGTGILGQHRTINYVFFIFILLWLWSLVLFSRQYDLYEKLTTFFYGRKGFVVAGVCTMVMLYTGNSGKILRDLNGHKFDGYRQEFIQRQASMINQPNAAISPLYNIPESFAITDARADSTWWVNKCMKYFYRDTHLELK